MKVLTYIFIFCAVTLYACQKVVNIDLKDADKKYVIEGIINDGPGPYTIKISQTKIFSDDNNFPTISGAQVIISDNTGITDTLKETSSGNYTTNRITGVQGRTYNLLVNVGGNTFSASSTMPAKVNLDSIYITTLAFFGDNIKCIIPAFTDPKNEKNNYHFEQYKNGILDKTLYSQNDEFSDGKVNSRPLIMNESDSAFKANDIARLEMQCVDENVYNYWTSLEQSTGSGTAPANPVTNIKGGALGYFSAHTSQTAQIVVK